MIDMDGTFGSEKNISGADFCRVQELKNYPLVIKHSAWKSTIYTVVDIFSHNKISIKIGGFPLRHVWLPGSEDRVAPLQNERYPGTCLPKPRAARRRGKMTNPNRIVLVI